MRLADVTALFRLSMNALLMGGVICSSHAQTGAAMLRIDCSGGNAKTEVYVDNKFRGECPVDIQVQEGTRRLRFYKNVDRRTEQVYEEDLKVGAGTIKRLEVKLPEPQLNAVARQEQEQHKARVRELEKEKLRQAELQLKEQIRLAEDGDMHTQYSVARRYARGDGLEKDGVKSKQWDRRAAESGHLLSKLMLDQNFTADQITNVAKLTNVLQEYYASSEFKMYKGGSLSSDLNLPILQPLKTHKDDYYDGSLYMGGLIASKLSYYSYGTFFNTLEFTVRIKQFNFIIGDVSRPLRHQKIFGFSVDEEITNESIKRSFPINRVLLCSKVLDMEAPINDLLYREYLKTDWANKQPFLCLERLARQSSTQTTMLINFHSETDPLSFSANLIARPLP